MMEKSLNRSVEGEVDSVERAKSSPGYCSAVYVGMSALQAPIDILTGGKESVSRK